MKQKTQHTSPKLIFNFEGYKLNYAQDLVIWNFFYLVTQDREKFNYITGWICQYDH
jgi:hypothetical protein